MDLIPAVLVVGLVAYRIWRFVALDELGDRIFGDRLSGDFWMCPWCAGFWITGLVTLIAWQTGLTQDPLWVWPAASVVCGWLGGTT